MDCIKIDRSVSALAIEVTYQCVSNLVSDGKRVEDFPLAGLLIELEETLGLKHIEDLFGDGHFAIAAGGIPVGQSVSVNDTLEEERALVGHALFIFSAQDIVRLGGIDHLHRVLVRNSSSASA